MTKQAVSTSEPTPIEIAVAGMADSTAGAVDSVSRVVDTVKETFTELVTFAKAVGPDVWGILVKQQVVEATSITIGLAVALMLLVWGTRIMKNRPDWAVDNAGDNAGGAIITIISAIASLVMTGVFLVRALPRFLNPAYYALMELATKM